MIDVRLKVFLSFLFGKRYTAIKNFFRRLRNKGKLTVKQGGASQQATLGQSIRVQEGPLVSIVMTVYNRERFLREAINSVLRQTYKNWELVVVDDGSTDGSVQIVRQFNDPRIRAFFLQHRGQLDALRFGMESSRGDYVTRLDSDDMLVPDCLETYVGHVLEKSDASFAYSPLLQIDEEGRLLGLWGNTQLSSGQQVLRQLYKTGYTVIPDVAFWKKEYCPFVIKNYIEKSIPFYLDNILDVNFITVEKPLYVYRVHGGNFHVLPTNFAAVCMGRLSTINYLVEHYSFWELTGENDRDTNLQKLCFAKRYYDLALDFLASSYENFGRVVPLEVSEVIKETLSRAYSVLSDVDERACGGKGRKLKLRIDNLMKRVVTAS